MASDFRDLKPIFIPEWISRFCSTYGKSGKREASVVVLDSLPSDTCPPTLRTGHDLK
jgi:hypothetical protein